MALFNFAPRKTAVVIDEQDQEFAKQYDTLANRLGVQCRVKRDVRLLEALQRQQIQVYELAKVERYMDRKSTWSWFPLRASDRCKEATHVWILERETPTEYPSMYGSVKNDIYPKPVPYPVLCTVQRLVDCFEDKVQFFVAAFDQKPDPFLGCRLMDVGQSKLVVVERWDEPTFRG